MTAPGPTTPSATPVAALEEALARIDALPDGVQAEVRRTLAAVLDVVGAGTVGLLEALAAAGVDLAEVTTADPDVAPLLELCGLEVPVATPVTLSSRPGCELCGTAMGSDHHHAADVSDRRLLCVCRGCSITLHGEGRYRALRAEVTQLEDGAGPPAWWSELDIPVELAFFLAGDDGVTAFYPGRAGVVESTLAMDALPVPVAPETEALLVLHHRRFEAWLVPVDRCYELAGIIRHAPKGMPPMESTGAFFERLRA